MKRLTAFVSGLAILMTVTLPVTLARADVNNFRVSSFTADYYLERNAVQTALLSVTEEIVVEFPDFDQNRGILRAIPEAYQDHTLSLRVDSVTDQEGLARPYSTYQERGNLVLKIGDGDRYVRGRQTYVIRYSMKNVVAFFDDHEEFYWDINGDQWLQPFDSVTARVHLDKELSAALEPRELCFAGAYGVSEQTCSVTRTKNGSIVTIQTQASNLGPQQTLTLVLGFKKGTFILGPEIAAEARRQKLLLIAAAVTFFLPILVTSFILFRRWSKRGRDPAGRGVIIPEYLPPKGLNALTSGIILHEKLPSKAISAIIIELAVKKYVHIYEIPKKGLFGKVDYELEIANDPGTLGQEETDALRLFFDDEMISGSRVKLSDLKNKLHSKLQALDKSLTTKMYQKGYFTNDPHYTRTRFVLIGVVMLVLGFASGFLLVTIPFALGLGLSGLLVILMSKAMPARSKQGVEARDYLYGLRDYMKLAESERLKVLQSPTGAEKRHSDLDPKKPAFQVKLFERLLPYAMLFEIEKDWAKQFEHLYTSPPDWYSGNWKTFSAVHLASSLNGFGTASSNSFVAPSSSGSSGFGGGGFSGGGGGGGGGGGW